MRGRRGGSPGSACRTSATTVYAGSTAAPTPSASRDPRAGDGGRIATGATACTRRSGRRRSTNRLLLEAGYGGYRSRWGGKHGPGLEDANLIRVVEQCATGCAATAAFRNLTYRSGNWSSNVNWNTQWNAAASLVTGSHSVKFGYQGALLYDDRKNFTNSEFLQVPRQQRRSGSDDADDQRVRRPISACAATRSTRRSSGRVAG